MKRLFDIVASTIALALLSPVLMLLAWRVRHDVGSPVLFRQVRPGLDARPFTMIKFRSMRASHDACGAPITDGDRITSLGVKLRASSIDELPELWNVLKGEMSIVGPRPLLMEYLPLYSKEQARRHEIRPGITGWAQICYPYGDSEKDSLEKLQFDLYYVKNYSLFLDLIILFQTAGAVLWGKGGR